MSAALAAIVAAIGRAGGWLPFDRYLDIALHDPNVGFYGGGRVQFGAGGDFITAPDISPLFAKMLAVQASEILRHSKGDFLELGAGEGRLSAALAKLLRGQIRRHYILETSAQLKAKQQQTLAGENVCWLSSLPESFSGIVFANEVLDAVPFVLFAKKNGEWHTRGVKFQNGALQFADRIADTKNEIVRRLAKTNLPNGSITEANPRAESLIKTLCEILQSGAAIFADYGFGRDEYYHPQRTTGTMMCHRAQIADCNPLQSPGDKDITAHVDFTAMAEAAIAGGATLAGYTSQAQFLLNCGIADTLQKAHRASLDSGSRGELEYAKLAAGAQKLLSPHETGELFKFIAFTKGNPPPLIGFHQRDQRHRL